MRKVDLSQLQTDLSGYLRLAGKEHIVITRHNKPIGVLIGFANEEAWFEYCLENDHQFLERIAAARKSLRAEQGVRLEDIS
jgi:prevent-host-death family protein